MMKFSQLIYRDKSRLDPKLKKKNCKTDFELYLIWHFLSLWESAKQIFILLCLNIESEPILISEILRWGHMGRFWEKRDLTY